MLEYLKAHNSRPQFVFLLALCSLLTLAFGQIQPTNAAGTSGTSAETTSSSQPLWSYQVKPNSYLNAPGGVGVSQSGHYGSVAPPSLFDAFNGLSQRQGALTSSPFLSILPIILIAAGGMLLLLPMLTMMMASPFGGGGAFGGYNNGAFGYPQVGALSKKRSLADQYTGQRGLIDILENVSSTIEELSKKYGNVGALPTSNKVAALAGAQKRAKSLLSEMDLSPTNHKPTGSSPSMEDNNNNSGGGDSNNSSGTRMASSQDLNSAALGTAK